MEWIEGLIMMTWDEVARDARIVLNRIVNATICLSFALMGAMWAYVVYNPKEAVRTVLQYEIVDSTSITAYMVDGVLMTPGGRKDFNTIKPAPFVEGRDNFSGESFSYTSLNVVFRELGVPIGIDRHLKPGMQYPWHEGYLSVDNNGNVVYSQFGEEQFIVFRESECGGPEVFELVGGSVRDRIVKVNSAYKFSSKYGHVNEFVKNNLDAAAYLQSRHGIPISVTLSQAAFESDWGRSRLAVDGNNFFGIKQYNNETLRLYKKNGWIYPDDPIYVHDDCCSNGRCGTNGGRGEEFYHFKSVADCYKARALLFTRPDWRYASLLDKSYQMGQQYNHYKKTGKWLTPAEVISYGLEKAGYATTNDYGGKLIRHQKRFNFHRFDTCGVLTAMYYDQALVSKVR